MNWQKKNPTDDVNMEDIRNQNKFELNKIKEAVFKGVKTGKENL